MSTTQATQASGKHLNHKGVKLVRHLPPNLKFLEGSAEQVAPLLLGCILERELNGQILSGVITEVEAYNQDDPASHTFNGRETGRAATMFGPAGHMYVYFTYGMHYCCNVVVGQPGHGAGVLIRAIDPLEGIPTMQANRGGRSLKELTNGPGKVCQALAIDKQFDGHDLLKPPIRLIPGEPLPADRILITPRIGISKAQTTPWRFVAK